PSSLSCAGTGTAVTWSPRLWVSGGRERVLLVAGSAPERPQPHVRGPSKCASVPGRRRTSPGSVPFRGSGAPGQLVGIHTRIASPPRLPQVAKGLATSGTVLGSASDADTADRYRSVGPESRTVPVSSSPSLPTVTCCSGETTTSWRATP